jgi:hypothetical protein
MSVRNELEKKIDRKKEEISVMETSLAAAKAYLQALQDTMKWLPRESTDEAPPHSLREGSDMAKARALISIEGKPLHISEILKGLGKEVTKENRLSLAGSLSGYARRGRIFTRPASNTFGLIELSKEHSGNNGHPSKPPEGFGL